MASSKKIVVMYHGDCLDGFSSAWAAYKKLGKSTEYIPVEHGLPPPKGLDGKVVYSIDFTYPEPITKAIAKKAKKLILIDHHISVKELVERQPEHLFSNNHSGAVLAWMYFHPKERLPKLLAYVQDIDLWRFKLPKTKELSAFLGRDNTAHSFKLWDKLVKEFEDPKKRAVYVKEGASIVRHDLNIINQRVAEGYETKFEGHRALVVNSPILQSEIGAAIGSKGYPIAIIWSVRNKMVHVSLRSPNKVDLSKIATKYGGGGHRSSAGFEISMNKKLPF